jgi:hypothetical protein
MDAGKIAAFYDDPVKRASDADSRARAFSLRSRSIDRSPIGLARRLARFGLDAARGALHARHPGSGTNPVVGKPAETAS